MTEDSTSYGISSLQDSLLPLARVCAAAECRTQVERADFLGIRQSSIADAKKRQAIPAEWLVKLLRLKGISPEWIMTGLGPKRLGPANDEEPTHVIYLTERRPPVECTAQELVNELVRRALAAL